MHILLTQAYAVLVCSTDQLKRMSALPWSDTSTNECHCKRGGGARGFPAPLPLPGLCVSCRLLHTGAMAQASRALGSILEKQPRSPPQEAADSRAIPSCQLFLHAHTCCLPLGLLLLQPRLRYVGSWDSSLQGEAATLLRPPQVHAVSPAVAVACG